MFPKYQKNAGMKYSLKEGNLSIVRKAHPTDSRGGEGSSGEGEEDSSGEGDAGKSEEIEMEGPLVHVAEDNEEDGATVEEKDDYFQDPTSINYVRFTPELCPFSLGTTWIFLSLTQYRPRGSQSM